MLFILGRHCVELRCTIYGVWKSVRTSRELELVCMQAVTFADVWAHAHWDFRGIKVRKCQIRRQCACD